MQLVLTEEGIDATKGPKLKDLVKAFQAAGAPNAQSLKVHSTSVGIIRKMLKEDIKLYHEHVWGYEEGEDESGEEFDMPDDSEEEEEDGWEDVTD